MPAAGFIVHRASRTEQLAETLADALESGRPEQPLRAQTVLVAHPGLKRWLLERFARRPGRAGAPGIAANYDLLLPGEWLERERRALLDEEPEAAAIWRPDVLRWRIHDVLRRFEHPALAAWLAGAEGERRRFELADRMAALYTQYLIYRPDWIAAWERSRPEPGDWQAALWKKLHATIAAPHRAERSAALAAMLRARGDGASDTLHVFGVSHLPGDVLAAFQALALHRPVHVYFPDPCREHWVYLRRQRDLLRLAADAPALHYEVGHPLLVALGRMAQDFCVALEALDAGETRDPLDDSDEAPGEALLAQLQESIRRMQPDLVGAGVRAAADAALRGAALRVRRNDASLRVHACHTPLRELEVLRDALLGFLADDATLQYADIVVMAPDIGRFAPYLGAVFGEAGRAAGGALQLPWHLADTGLVRTHALIGAFARVLEIGDSRLAVSDVLGLLDVPALARRHAIDPDARATLERWLRRAHVAWGLDAEMKAQAGAAAVPANSWAFGFDRLYAGLASGDTGGAHLVDGVLPLDGLGGGALEALGQLDRLIGELRRARDAFAVERPLGAWCAWLGELVERLFRIDPADAAERAALDAVVRTIGALAREAVLAGSEAPVAWAVVQLALRAALDAVPERQPFLLGGVTFCGLVPQRSIPFRAVCLIGMNEGDFPRGAIAAGINRMALAPRRGDRDARSEDRYLFLEAIMAARGHLHISYVGCDAQDGKPRNPAAPLGELLQFLDDQHGIAAQAQDDRPWRVVHPLQPFARAYFDDSDARLFSFDPALARFDRAAAAAGRPFFAANAGTPSAAGGTVAVGDLIGFWKDPARAALRDGAGISLQALDSNDPPDREPLAARFERVRRVEARLFDAALAGGLPSLPAQPPEWLARSGELAPGRAGALAFDQARAAVDAALDQARRLPAFARGALARRAQTVDVGLGDGLRLTGVVERVLAAADGTLTVFAARVVGATDFRHLLPLYIDYAALRLAADAAPQLHFVPEASAGADARRIIDGVLEAMRAQSAAQLRAGLRTLVRLRGDGLTPLPFLPVSAWAFACAAADARLDKARKAWANRAGERGEDAGEREFAPGYAALLARGGEPYLPGSVFCGALTRTIAAVGAVLDPGRRVLLAGEPSLPAGDGA